MATSKILENNHWLEGGNLVVPKNGSLTFTWRGSPGGGIMLIEPSSNNVQVWALTNGGSANLCLGSADSHISVTVNGSEYTVTNSRNWAIPISVIGNGGIRVVS